MYSVFRAENGIIGSDLSYNDMLLRVCESAERILVSRMVSKCFVVYGNLKVFCDDNI